MPNTIYYVAHHLGGTDGGGQAGADILASLLTSGRDVAVVSRGRCALPDAIDGVPLASPSWLPATEDRPFPTRPGRSWPRAAARALRSRVADLGPRARLLDAARRDPPALVVFNGFPKHGTFLARRLPGMARSAVLVQSPPEAVPFFARHDPRMSPEHVAAALRRFDRYVFISRAVRDAWARSVPFRPEDAVVIYSCAREERAEAIRAEAREALRARLGLPRDALVMLTVAKVDPGKGHDVLAAALPAVVAAVPSVVACFVGDAHSAWARDLRAGLEARVGAERVRFPGIQEDVFPWIGAADMMVHPTRAEGLSLAILEGMAVGLPVVSTRVGGVPEVVVDGETGLLVADGDAQALGRAVLELARDAELRRRFGEAGRLRYREHFRRALHAQRFRTWLSETVPDGETTAREGSPRGPRAGWAGI